MNSDHIQQKIQQLRPHQIVAKTGKGYLVMADFGDGLLIVVADESYAVMPIMRNFEDDQNPLVNSGSLPHQHYRDL